MIEHQCVLPLTWRQQPLRPDQRRVRCVCGKVRVLVDTRREQGSRFRFETVAAPASNTVVAWP